jgi:hypothetical protein
MQRGVSGSGAALLFQSEPPFFPSCMSFIRLPVISAISIQCAVVRENVIAGEKLKSQQYPVVGNLRRQSM